MAGGFWLTEPVTLLLPIAFIWSWLTFWSVYLRIYVIAEQMILWYTDETESQNTSKAAYPPPWRGLSLQLYGRRAMPMYITYSDLIQIGIFIVALIGLIYEIFKDKK